MSEISQQLNIPLAILEYESVRIYLENRLRALQTEMYVLSKKHGITTALEFDSEAKKGRFHEDAFEDYIAFDHIESEIKKIHSVLDRLA